MLRGVEQKLAGVIVVTLDSQGKLNLLPDLAGNSPNLL